MPVLDGWLGMSLSTATVVIGWISAFLCCLQGVLIFMLLKEVDVIVEQSIRASERNREQRNIIVYNMKMILTGILLVYIMLIALDLVACIVLVIGASQDNKLMVLPWLVTNAVSITFKIVSSCCSYLMWLCSPDHSGSKILNQILNIPWILLHIWMWLVVESLFVELHEYEKS